MWPWKQASSFYKTFLKKMKTPSFLLSALCETEHSEKATGS